MSFEDLAEKLASVVAIPVTPFDTDGLLDVDAHRELTRRLIDAGIEVITPNGNVGEFYALAPGERRQVVEDVCGIAERRVEVLTGVGGDVATVIDSARHAQRCGSRMVMVHQPVHPFVSADGWVDYHEAIASAVSEMGVVLYMRDPRIDGEQVARLGERCPNVIGVKYAVTDPVRFASVARDAGLERFVWIAGLAELSAPSYWAVGARGFTSGVANVDPRLPLTMLGALRRGDYSAAMQVWELVRRFEELRAADGSANNVAIVKEAMAQLGLCGRQVRPPGRLLTEAERREVAAAIADWSTPS